MFSIFTYFWSFSPYFVISPISQKKKSFISNTHHLQFHRKNLKHTTTTLTTELPLSLSLSHHRVTFSNATFVSIKEARSPSSSRDKYTDTRSLVEKIVNLIALLIAFPILAFSYPLSLLTRGRSTAFGTFSRRFDHRLRKYGPIS